MEGEARPEDGVGGSKKDLEKWSREKTEPILENKACS